MTLVCGLIDLRSSSDLGHHCQAMLSALAPYGNTGCEVVAVPGAAFATLKSDRTNKLPESRGLFTADLRLDNRREMEAHLGCSTSTDDITSVGNLLAADGRAALGRLIGDFAIAWYDRASGQLTLARDVTGQRALFYARRGSMISFASMPVAIIAAPGFWRGFDRSALAEMLCDRPPRNGATGFSGIVRVPPGQMLILSQTREQKLPIWEPDLSHFDSTTTKLTPRNIDDFWTKQCAVGHTARMGRSACI